MAKTAGAKPSQKARARPARVTGGPTIAAAYFLG